MGARLSIGAQNGDRAGEDALTLGEGKTRKQQVISHKAKYALRALVLLARASR